MHGGSRFNLRWKDAIPSDDRSPDAIAHLLVGVHRLPARRPGGGNAQPAYGSAPPPSGYAPAPANQGMQIQRGMKLNDVAAVYGQGRMVSESTSEYGMKTQVIEYQMGESIATVTYVEGVVVRYSISSR